MTDLEHDLQQVLRRREPPRDLTAGIIARLGARLGARVGAGVTPARVSWRAALAIAAAVLVMVTGIDQGLRAKHQLMFALELTSQKLGVAQEKVSEVSHKRIGHD